MAAKVSKTVWGILLIAAIAVVVFVSAFRPGTDRPTTVALGHPVRQDLRSWTTGNGKVEPIDPRIIQSQLTTRIESVQVKEGNAVKAGSILFTLDATDAKLDLARMKEQLIAAQQDRKTGIQGGSIEDIAQIESDLAKTNAEIGHLKNERDVLQRLFASQATTRQDVEQNKVALEKALAEKDNLEQKKRGIAQRSSDQVERASLKADEARDSIQSLEQKINSARVSAPVTGTIYALSAKSGTFVHMGDTLAEIADLKLVRVRAFIDEPELGSLKEGQPVEITWDALPGRAWTGIVEQLPKTIVTRGSRNVGEVLCSVNNDEGANDDGSLLPNTNVNVRIRTAERQNILTVPRAAVHSERNRRYVFVVENGRLRRKDVMVGISDPTIYEILGGIAETDTIALQSDSDLREGQMVAGSEK